MSLAEDFMVWNITKDEIRVRVAIVEEHTWVSPLASEAQPPRGAPDKQVFSENSGVPVDAIGCSYFIKGGRWREVDEALRGVYKEASESLGRDFVYPGDEK